MVQDDTSFRKHQDCRGKENDPPMQGVPQALDKKRLGCTVHRNYTQGAKRKMETFTVDLTFKFKYNQTENNYDRYDIHPWYFKHLYVFFQPNMRHDYVNMQPINNTIDFYNVRRRKDPDRSPWSTWSIQS